MFLKTRNTPGYSPTPGEVTDMVTGSANGGLQFVADSRADSTSADGSAATDRETRRERSRRKAHRSRLHGYAILAVVLVACLIALAASNTTHVKVSWLFGSSRVSLVWLLLFAAILGWLLGLVGTAAFHWRTRAPGWRGGAHS
jgi:uncharacterized integral membrane protein